MGFILFKILSFVFRASSQLHEMDDIFNGMSDLSVQQVALNTDAKGRLLLIRSTQFCSNKVHHIAHPSGTANRNHKI